MNEKNEPAETTEVTNGDELISEIVTPTEQKAPGSSATPTANENPNDFAQEKPQTTADKPVEQKVKTFVGDDTAASLTTDTFDFIQTMTFNAINLAKKRKRLGDDEELAEELYYDVYIDKIKKLDSLSPKEKKLVRQFRELREVEQRIQMTKEENEKMTESLAMIFKDTGFKMSPMFAGILSLARVMAVRVSDAIAA